MLRKTVLTIIVLLVIVLLYLGWKVAGSGTAFEGNKYTLFVKTGAGFEEVLQTLRSDNVLKDPGLFNFLARQYGLPRNLKAGRYEIKRGASVLGILQMLRNGRQSPVNLVITKLRTKEDFARFLGNRMECDSMSVINFLNSPDSLRSMGLDTNNVMTMVIPNTYSFFWNTPVTSLMRRLHHEEQKFWNDSRIKKAQNIGLTPQQVYILASVIEEETTKYDEMPLMASVYINRLNRGMPLGADPTIKYAIRNFAAKRVTLKMISESAASPYNTYKNKGLPPGPICTPAIKTIDATLEAASTNYLYFCAKPDFSGYHNFAVTDAEHFKNARAYQKALNRLNIN